MLNRLKYMGLMLLLIVALQAAGQSYVIDSICVNTQRQYRMDGEAKSTYLWMLTDAANQPVALSNPAGVTTIETDPVSGAVLTVSEVTIQWPQPGIFTLKAIQYSEFGCDTLEQGRIIVYDHPLADAGVDATICPNATYLINDATASHYSALRWSSSGDGTFDNDTVRHPVYTSGPNDAVNGKVILTLTAQGKGAGGTCIPAIATMELNIINLTARLDTTGITCYEANDASIRLTDPLGGQGGYKYSIDKGLTWTDHPFFENLGQGTYFVQMRDTIMQTCIATIDTIEFAEPQPLNVDSIETRQITCLGNDGSISVINPHGGFGVYEFSLNETLWQSSVLFTGLAPDITYIVWMRDALYQDCQISLDTILFKQPAPLMADTSHVNVSCYGGSDGSISLSNPLNGSGTYQYKLMGSDWTSGMTDFTFEPLTAGEYTVLIRDLNAPTCIDTLGIFHIAQPDRLTAQVDSTRITCFGADDGTITFTNPQGGSADYRYSIDNGESWSEINAFTNRQPGRYDVWIGDQQAQSCKEYLGVVWIGEPKPLTADVESSPITCRDANDGVIQITNAQQGILPYQYSINGIDWIDSPYFQSLIPGSYIVQMKDFNGCIQNLDTLAFTNPEPLRANVLATNTTCLGHDGTIQVLNPENAVSGTYQFAVSNITPTASEPLQWQSEGEFKQLQPDTFVVWIRDSLYEACGRILDTLLIEEPKPLAAEFITSDVTCYDGSNGTIQVNNPRGGSGRFEYRLLNTTAWNAESRILNLSMGDYVLEMRDSISPVCWITVDTLHIDQPSLLEAEPVVVSNVSCHGGNDGAIRFENVRGGSGSAEFSFNGLNWFENEMTSLPADTYQIQMRDRKDTLCIVQFAEIIITEPLQIMAALDADSVSCFGGSDGRLTVGLPVNGTAPYGFSSDGGLTWQTDSVFAGLPAGTYSIRIKDSKDCMAQLDSVKVEQPERLAATPVAKEETMTGADDGTITMTNNTGGSGIYKFSIDSIKWQDQTVFDSLAPREYTVWILDAQTVDCRRSYKIKVAPSGTILFTYDLDSVKCFGGNDGRITFTNPKGATNYDFSIDGGINWSTDPVFNGLTAGAYELLVRNADDVIKDSNPKTIQLMEPERIEADIQIRAETNAGRKDGSLEILSPHGGSGGYQYRLDNGVWGTSPKFTGLSEGNYTLWIKDKYNCQKDTTVTLPPAGSLTISVLSRDATCRGKNDGEINYEKPLGGSGSFDYNIGAGWEPFTGTFTWSKLTAGTYTFLMRDTNDPVNEISIDHTIKEPKWLVEITTQASGTKNNLIAAIIGSDGTPPFTYLWSDGQKTATAYNLDFDYYSVTVTDFVGCMSYRAIKLGFQVSAELVKPILCPGDKATIRIKAWDGGNPYKLIQNGQIFTDKEWVDLEVTPRATPYSFQVEDASGTMAWTTPIVVTGPEPLTATVAAINVSCAGTNGKIKLSNPKGGSGQPYQYRINQGAWTEIAVDQTVTVSDLPPGDYSVELRESGSSCMPATWNLTIDDALPITLAAKGTDPVCFEDNGSIDFTFTHVPDGTYTITHSTGSFSMVVIKNNSAKLTAKAGVYKNLRLTANGCSSADIVDVTLADGLKLLVMAEAKNPNCKIRSGSIKITSPIGSNYMYSIDDGTTFKGLVNFTNLASGDYLVSVKEMTSGCESLVKKITIDPLLVVPDAPAARVTGHPDCNVTGGTITVDSPLGAAYLYSVNGATFQSSPVFNGLAPGSYPVTVKASALGCISEAILLTVNAAAGAPDAPIARVTVQSVCSLETGTIEVSFPLGAGFLYSKGGTTFQSSPVFTGLLPGSYEIRVKDEATGCESAPISLTIIAFPGIPDTPEANVTIQPDCMVPLGTIEVSAPLGSNYVYRMDGGDYQAEVKFEGLAPNSIHTFQVKDISTGCESLVATVQIDSIPPNPETPDVRVTVVPACNNLEGTVTVFSPTGVEYSYSLDGGNYQISPVFEKLQWGTHSVMVQNRLTQCESAPGQVIVPANPPPPVITAVAENSKCFGGLGMINLSITNTANGVYTIKYEDGEFRDVHIVDGKGTIPVPEGTYYNLNFNNPISGCDSYNPQNLVDVTITQPTEIVITETIVELDLKTNSKGSIDVVVTGGTGKFSYQWSNELTTPHIDNLKDGSYTIMVTDENGCKKSKAIRIPPPNYPPLAVDDNYSTGCSVIQGNVILNDSDPENNTLFIGNEPVVKPLHGTLTLNIDGTFRYISKPLFSGTDYFVYALFDKTLYPGITAKVTFTIVSDIDHDGIADTEDLDADGDGILNIYEALPGEDWQTADRDGDGLPNYLDIDSDGDGILDNFEAQKSKPGYRPPVIYDADGNGVNDAYDLTQSGYEIHPIDTDGDGIPDYLDLDSDNDGVPDRIEGHDINSDGKPDYFSVGRDEDGDGLDDGYDSVFNECGILGNALGSFAAMQDFDGDGMPDWRDENDDNDSYPTKYEDLNADNDFSNDDIDMDGFPEYLDYGRECDLFIPNSFSPNGDNIHELFQIYCINHYPNAKMYIFDQVGTKLFEKANYGNLDVWKTHEEAWWNGKVQNGRSNYRSGLVPPGTYYYVLDLGNGEVKKSFVFVSY